ncbi:glycosyltransferase family 1 protein [Gillisia limnaea]|uniref:Glycosyl transferase group 1 n=1 Tax=Gillisia limnaea (strain DSM 15749 / LMG 21470 / R-8282) TaxID=865937 RepID=H2BV89_GILLR|nr:glycosyl transferase group 1 [Gillisia limnaea DSM 15749]
MKVLIDNQIFEQQKFGGISRYFNMLERGNDAVQKMELFTDQSPKKKEFYQRVQSKLTRTLFNGKQPKANKYDFYNSQIRDLQFDVFHPTYYGNYFLNYLKTPFVVTVYDMIHEKYAEYFGNSRDSFNKRNLCNSASKIIAISNSTKKDLIDIFNIPKEKIEVIYLATDYASIISIKPKFDIDHPYVLFTGNRSAYKNFLTFLISVAPILKNNKDLHLVCTGPDFTAIENRWIEELEIKSKVNSYFCQSDGELVHLYTNAECFVFPSLYEGFGFPLLEAFACNCPVISSPGGSLKEIAGNAAIYFDPKDIKSIRNTIQNVISDSTLKLDLIEAGKIRLKDFSWEKCRKETMDLYAKVI